MSAAVPAISLRTVSSMAGLPVVPAGQTVQHAYLRLLRPDEIRVLRQVAIGVQRARDIKVCRWRIRFAANSKTTVSRP